MPKKNRQIKDNTFESGREVSENVDTAVSPSERTHTDRRMHSGPVSQAYYALSMLLVGRENWLLCLVKPQNMRDSSPP